MLSNARWINRYKTNGSRMDQRYTGDRFDGDRKVSKEIEKEKRKMEWKTIAPQRNGIFNVKCNAIPIQLNAREQTLFFGVGVAGVGLKEWLESIKQSRNRSINRCFQNVEV
mmetsp:Transcript_86990/g.177196  ORF Transcript_86990/g.177196 Transcript_86990/m.177196 type:complete len:111 (-) Transcript_86990:107-439(-)